MAGTVEKIVPSSRPSQPEQAQIAVDGAEPRHRDLRIENALIDEHGDDVKLKKGAHVAVTVTAESFQDEQTATVARRRDDGSQVMK
jgi:hypothetical protein